MDGACITETWQELWSNSLTNHIKKKHQSISVLNYFFFPLNFKFSLKSSVKLYLCFMYQKMVAQPKPVATLRWESALGKEDRKSALQRPSCQVISWLTSSGMNLMTSSSLSHLQPNRDRWQCNYCFQPIYYLWLKSVFTTVPHHNTRSIKHAFNSCSMLTWFRFPQHNAMHLSTYSNALDFFQLVFR